MNVFVRRAQRGGRRRDVDDQSPASASAGGHRDGSLPRAQDCAVQVEVDDPADDVRRRLRKIADVERRTCVVDQAADLAQLGARDSKESLDVGVVCDVGLDRNCAATRRSDLRDNFCR